MSIICCIDDATWKESPLRRWVLYVFCFATVSTAAGIVYGWPALRRQLQADGSTLDESSLGAIFTVGAWSTQGGRFFVGLARDRYGTKRVTSTCIFLVAMGSVGVAWSGSSNAPALGVSMFLVGLGSGAQLCVQPVAGLFPDTSGTVIATLSGAFQISGLVFLAFTSGYEAGTRKARFTGYAIIMVVITVCAMILLPMGKSFVLEQPISSNTQARISNDNLETAPTEREISSTLRDTTDGGRESPAVIEERNATHLPIEEGAEADSEEVDVGAQAGKVENSGTPKDPEVALTEEDATSQADPITLLEQLKSIEYICLCIWFSICLIPLQYYIGSIGFQLEDKGDTGFYSDLFSIVYAAAFVVSPAGGFLSDKLSFGITQGLATVMCAGSFFFLASNISLKGQAIGLVLYGVGRLLVFGMYFANCGNRFGYANFGTLARLGLLTSALISLLQSPMISAAANGQARTVNLCSGALLVAQLPYFVWLHRREKKVPGAQY